MTADTVKMREAAGNVASEKSKYDNAINEIDKLITSTLGQYWGDEAYDEMKEKYISKSRSSLQGLSETLKEFSNNLTNTSDELDRAINSLR